MWKVKVLTIYHGEHEWSVSTGKKAREYAKRIITEGFWYIDGIEDEEVFLPVWQVQKVKIYYTNVREI